MRRFQAASSASTVARSSAANSSIPRNSGSVIVCRQDAISTRCALPCASMRTRAATRSSWWCGPQFSQRRNFAFKNPFKKESPNVKVMNAQYDKEAAHYAGTIFGVPADTVVFYLKVGGGALAVLLTFSFFMKGYTLLASFSIASVARLGFFGGFICCGLLYSTALALRRRYRINPNAVYNQSISIAMNNPDVAHFLGSSPRTGEFKAYCSSGGFKLPLMRRMRSGTYELSDLLGLKPRRLQMMFILRNPASGREGLVTCEVRKETSGFMTSSNVYRSLAVTLTDTGTTDEPKTIIIIGGPQDVVYRGLMKM